MATPIRHTTYLHFQPEIRQTVHRQHYLYYYTVYILLSYQIIDRIDLSISIVSLLVYLLHIPFYQSNFPEPFNIIGWDWRNYTSNTSLLLM